jgi:hypothetical protein
MRVLAVIAPLVGAAFMILFVLTDPTRDLSRLSYHSPPDLENSDDWDVALDEFDDTVPGVVSYAEQWPVSPYRIARTQGYNFRGNSNGLVDPRSPL